MARGQEPNEPGWYITRRGDRRYWDGSAWGPTEAEYYQRQSLVNAALATSPYIGLDTSGESADDHAARLAAEEAAVAGYARRLRGRGSLLVYSGLVLACVVLVVTIGILSEGGGGIIWHGGVLVGLLLVWRGIRHWRAARNLGIRTGGLRWAIFGVLALVAVSLAQQVLAPSTTWGHRALARSASPCSRAMSAPAGRGHLRGDLRNRWTAQVLKLDTARSAFRSTRKHALIQARDTWNSLARRKFSASWKSSRSDRPGGSRSHWLT